MTLSFEKISLGLSSEFTASPNRRFQFHERGQLFIGTHNKTLSVIAVCVSNPDYSSLRIQG
jgi:hypothetical protein